ncbi:MAG: hypothetical protein PHV82_00100 [Victivallaceae bacterium]|nr:hypothetical protein [Victivallaceae bacterium]
MRYKDYTLEQNAFEQAAQAKISEITGWLAKNGVAGRVGSKWGPRNGMVSGCYPPDEFYKARSEAEKLKI